MGEFAPSLLNSLPIEVNNALKAQPEMFKGVSIGKDIFDDAYEFFKTQKGKELDGVYGEWIKSSAYAAYGGESVNLRKFREALASGMTREQAAFETVTGTWAKEKGFDKVRFFGTLGSEICDKFNRVEVIFYK